MSREYELAFRMKAELEPRFGQVFSSAQNKIGDMQRKLQQLEKSDAFGKKIANSFDLIKDSAGGVASTISKLTAAGGLLAGGAGVVGAGMAINGMVESMAQLEAATGATSTQMKELRQITNELYKENLGESYSDLADAVGTAVQVTDMHGKALEDAVRMAVTYRDIFKEDVPESLKASDTMMKNFGITSSNAYNLLAQGVQRGLDKSQELLDSANEYAPHFASLGFTANEMFDTFSAGLESGAFNLDKVGDAVKEFNIRSKDMSKTSVSAYEALNMNAAEMSRIFAEGGPNAQKAFKTVVKAISSIKDPVKKNNIGVALMGTQFEDLEKDVIASMGSARKQFDMTLDTMEQINKVKYDTPLNAFSSIGRIIQTDLLQPIGYDLLPYMEKFGDKAGEFATKYAPQISEGISDAIDTATKYIDEHFINNPSFQRLESIQSKIQFIFDDIGGTVNAWWDKTGNETFKKLGRDIAGSMVDGLNNILEDHPLLSGLAVGAVTPGPLPVKVGAAVATTSEGYTRQLDTFLTDFMQKVPSIPFVSGKANELPSWMPGVNEREKQAQGHASSSERMISAYADGGYVTRPELAWIGEGRYPEWIIPQNDSGRSRSLWQAAGRSIGALPKEPSGGAGGDFHFSPTYIIQGNADQAAVRQMEQRTRSDFAAEFEAWKTQRRRLAFQ